MALFPLFIDFQNKPVLIVGGGAVALRKAHALYEVGARLCVVSQSALPELRALCQRVVLKHVEASQDCALTGQYFLRIAATSDLALNERLTKSWDEAGLLSLNVSSKVPSNSFFPRRLSLENVDIAVSGRGDRRASAKIIAALSEILDKLA